MNVQGLFMTKTMTAHKKKPALGSGKRFAAIEAKAKKSGATNPGAIAAVAGTRKYGQKKMTAMSVAGKKRHAK